MSADFAADAIAEVHDLHRFFEGWLSGTEPRGGFERCAGALAPGFVQIDPGGQVNERDRLIARLEAAHGRGGPGFRIRVADCVPRVVAGDLCLIEYVEHQETISGPTARRSSALLGRAPATPTGVAWLHLHESWIVNPSTRTGGAS